MAVTLFLAVHRSSSHQPFWELCAICSASGEMTLMSLMTEVSSGIECLVEFVKAVNSKKNRCLLSIWHHHQMYSEWSSWSNFINIVLSEKHCNNSAWRDLAFMPLYYSARAT